MDSPNKRVNKECEPVNSKTQKPCNKGDSGNSPPRTADIGMNPRKTFLLPGGISIPRFQPVIDTREKLPYPFPDSVSAALPAGDYSIRGFEKLFAIERKTLTDAWRTLGSGSKRFAREMEKAGKYLAFEVVVEAPVSAFTAPELYNRRLSSERLKESVCRIRQKYGVNWIFAPNRRKAARYVYWRLRSWYEEYRAGLWKKE